MKLALMALLTTDYALKDASVSYVFVTIFIYDIVDF